VLHPYQYLIFVGISDNITFFFVNIMYIIQTVHKNDANNQLIDNSPARVYTKKKRQKQNVESKPKAFWQSKG